MGKRTDVRLAANRAQRDDAMIQDDDVVPYLGVAYPDATVNFATLADDRVSLETDARMNDGVGSDFDVSVDERRRRVLERDAGGHQRCSFRLPDDAADLGQFGPAVDAANLVFVSHPDRLDVAAL